MPNQATEYGNMCHLMQSTVHPEPIKWNIPKCNFQTRLIKVFMIHLAM